MTVKQHIPLEYFFINSNSRGTILSWESCKATGKPYKIRKMETIVMGQETCRIEFENITTINCQIQMCARALNTNMCQITSWVNKSTNPIVKYDVVNDIVNDSVYNIVNDSVYNIV